MQPSLPLDQWFTAQTAQQKTLKELKNVRVVEKSLSEKTAWNVQLVFAEVQTPVRHVVQINE
jgi:hypothetical protein